MGRGSAALLLALLVASLVGCGETTEMGVETCRQLDATYVELANGDWVCTDTEGVVVYQPDRGTR